MSQPLQVAASGADAGGNSGPPQGVRLVKLPA